MGVGCALRVVWLNQLFSRHTTNYLLNLLTAIPRFVLEVLQEEKTNMRTQGNHINTINEILMNILKAKKGSGQNQTNRTCSYMYAYVMVPTLKV